MKNHKLWQMANLLLMMAVGIGAGMILPPNHDLGFVINQVAFWTFAVSHALETGKDIKLTTGVAIIVGVLFIVLRLIVG